MARRMIDNGESPRAVARTLKIGKSTLYRHLPGACSVEAEALL
jgi:DNA invertase Pin-like site-specific DNA recombinase